MADNPVNENVGRSIEISASVVFYNPTRSELRQTANNIKHLMAVKEFNFKFYLIDNGSTEHRLDTSLFDGVRKNTKFIFLNKNVGFGRGHNQVLPLIKSNYHIIMNPDINFNDGAGLRRAVKYLQEHDKVVLLSPLVKDNNTKKVQYLNRQLPSVFDLVIRFLGPWAFPKRQAWFTKQKDGYGRIQDEVNATGSFMLLRTKKFVAVNGFDPRFFMYFEDTDLTNRLLQHGRVVMCPELTVYHGWKRANHSLTGMWPMISSMVKYFNKWGWK